MSFQPVQTEPVDLSVNKKSPDHPGSHPMDLGCVKKGTTKALCKTWWVGWGRAGLGRGTTDKISFQKDIACYSLKGNKCR